MINYFLLIKIVLRIFIIILKFEIEDTKAYDEKLSNNILLIINSYTITSISITVNRLTIGFGTQFPTLRC